MCLSLWQIYTGWFKTSVHSVWHLCTPLVRSVVSISLDWSPWFHGRLSEVSRIHCMWFHGRLSEVSRIQCTWFHERLSEVSRIHCTWFLLVGTFEGQGLPSENTKFGSPKRRYYRSIRAHNIGRVKVSSPLVGETHTLCGVNVTVLK
jgi:hypothetical protein